MSALALLLVAGPLGAQAPAGTPALARTLAAGDSAWDRGARDSAYACYRRAVDLDPVVSTQVLFRLARLESDRNRLEPATGLLREYVRREPADHEGRLALARVLSWRGRYDESIAVYDEVLARDSTYRDAALGRAQVLAWADRIPAALAAYERWLAYAPGDSAAARGVARTVGWSGDLARSERLWRDLTRRNPGDVESWLGLAQVQRWAGRVEAADASLRRALSLAPTSAEAREALEQVTADLSGAAEPSGTHSVDSDGNRMSSGMVSMVSPPMRGAVRLRLIAALREADYHGVQGTSLGVRGGATWSTPGGGFTASTEGGATRLTSRGRADGSPSRTRPWMVARLSGARGSRVSAGLTYSAVPFDETAMLIAGGIHTAGLEGDLSVTLPGRVSLGMGAGQTTILGGTVPNGRLALGASARWAVHRGLSLAVAARGMGYDTSGRADGYFSPNRFILAEGSARQVLGGDRGWGATIEGGVGRQQIRFAAGDTARGSLAARGALTLRYTPLPGYVVEASGGASSVASPYAQQGAEYSVRWFSLRGRIRAF